MDLPCDQETAGGSAYAEAVMQALRDVAGDLILVGHSAGGLTIPLVAQRRQIRGLVFLCAQLPVPGKSLAQQLTEEPECVSPFYWNSVKMDADGRAVLPPEVLPA